jgi:hypothetical protein
MRRETAKKASTVNEMVVAVTHGCRVSDVPAIVVCSIVGADQYSLE